MKTHTSLKAFVLAAFALGAASAQSLQKDVHWRDLCSASQNSLLIVTTSAGQTVEGRCLTVSETELTLSTEDHGLVKIARATLSKTLMKTGRGNHELRNLHRDVHELLKREVSGLLTETGPLDLIAIPPTLAWEVAAAPFCALGDLRNSFEKSYVLRVL